MDVCWQWFMVRQGQHFVRCHAPALIARGQSVSWKTHRPKKERWKSWLKLDLPVFFPPEIGVKRTAMGLHHNIGFKLIHPPFCDGFRFFLILKVTSFLWVQVPGTPPSSRSSLGPLSPRSWHWRHGTPGSDFRGALQVGIPWGSSRET